MTLARPCRCTSRLAQPGGTCAVCGRSTIPDLIAAARGWFEPREDATLRTLRGSE